MGVMSGLGCFHDLVIICLLNSSLRYRSSKRNFFWTSPSSSTHLWGKKRVATVARTVSAIILQWCRKYAFLIIQELWSGCCMYKIYIKIHNLNDYSCFIYKMNTSKLWKSLSLDDALFRKRSRLQPWRLTWGWSHDSCLASIIWAIRAGAQKLQAMCKLPPHSHAPITTPVCLHHKSKPSGPWYRS